MLTQPNRPQLVFAALALVGLYSTTAHGADYNWDGSSSAKFTHANNWTPAVVPGDMDTAIFRLGAVPPYLVWLFEGLFVPANHTVHRMIVGTNTATFWGGVLTVDATGDSENAGLIIGQTASDVAVVNIASQGLSTLRATLGSAAGSSGTLNVNSGTFKATATPFLNYGLIVGLNGTGAINVSGGNVLVASDTALGLNSGSIGSVSVSGAGSSWSNPVYGLWVGVSGGGTLSITSDGDVTSGPGIVGYSPGATGAVTVSGTGSSWTSSSELRVGSAGSGTMDIELGGQVSNTNGYIGSAVNSFGEVNISGNNSTWTNSGFLLVGAGGSSFLNVSNGGDVSNGSGTVGSINGAMAKVTIDGAGSTWVNNIELIIGSDAAGSNGRLDVTNGGAVTSPVGYVGFGATAVGLVNVVGIGSTWTDSGALYIGNYGDGTLNITAGGRVTVNASGYIGREGGSMGEVNVDGAGSILTTSSDLWAGFGGNGTLSITGGADVSSPDDGRIGHVEGSIGEVTVDGSGSTWTIGDNLSIGNNDGNGTLYITNGGQINSGYGTIAQQSVATGEVTVDGIGSTWTITNTLTVGVFGNGTLNVTAGGNVASSVGYIGYYSDSTGEVTVDGLGSTWTTGGDLYVGYGGDGTLTVTNGALVDPANVIVGALGTIRGDGKILSNVQNSGLVSPGTSPGALQIYGDYTQNLAGELLIELASASSYDQLLVTNVATLLGTLTVNLIDGFTPGVGQSFTILTADDVDGTFDIEMLPSLPNLEFDVIYNATSVVLAVSSALPGDYNADGAVDAADYVVWRKSVGAATLNNRDPNGMGPVGEADYNFWRARFGNTIGSGAGGMASARNAVPEPCTLILALAGLGFWKRLRVNHRHET
ncbi:MAG: hypothetical protein WD738_10920 [Pirellulales bacterium]